MLGGTPPRTVAGMTAPIPTGLTVRSRRLELAGLPTAVLEGGEGSPIVLLDGLGEAASASMRVILGLAETHRVIAPDLPAHGHPRALAWLSELIACSRAQRPALVAYVPGGAIAAGFAIERGEALRALVLVNTLGEPTVAAGDLARIDIPTSLIWGSGAEVAGLRAAEEASERHGWPLRVIDDCGNPARDRPAELLRALHVALGRTVTCRPGSAARRSTNGSAHPKRGGTHAC